LHRHREEILDFFGDGVDRPQRDLRYGLHQCRIGEDWPAADLANEHVTDTLSLARRKHPMGPNSLDALCRRYGVDNSHRQSTARLLDSELLAKSISR
jgi:DNA polymerase-3 subunit epsilon